MPDTVARILEIVRRELETSRAPKCYPDLSADDTFERDLLCSTVDLVCISMSIEEEFGIELPAEVENCGTIQALADLVDRVRGRVGV